MPPPQQSNIQNNPPAGQAPKYAPPPSNLPLYQRVDPKAVTFFAKTFVETVSEQKQHIFGIKRADRLRHIYTIGKSGSGKTKLLELFVRQDIAYGHGVLLLDPIGDVARDVLNFIPKTRTGDVVLVDVLDAGFPFVWNPLVDIPEALRHRYAQALVDVFELQFGAGWTSRIEHVLRFIFLALLDYPHATIKDIVPLLTDAVFRKEVAGYIRDAGVRQFWTHEYDLWEDRFAAEAVMPVVSKVRAIFADPMLGVMFGSGATTLSLADALEKNRIIIVNLARAQFGTSDAKFLASLLLGLFSVVAIDAGTRGVRKTPFYVFADDVCDAFTPSVEAMLSESRRNLVGAYISQQHTGELSSALKRFMMGNMGTILAFHVSPDDATWLEPEFAPVFKAKELSVLPPRVCVVKMTIDGNTQDPFLAESLVVHKTPEQNGDAARSASRATYARARADVEQGMLKKQQAYDALRTSAAIMDKEIKIMAPPLAPVIPPQAPFAPDAHEPTAPETQAGGAIPDAEGEATKELRED